MIDELKEAFESEFKQMINSSVNGHLESFKDSLKDEYSIELVASYYCFLYRYYFESTLFLAADDTPFGGVGFDVFFYRIYFDGDYDSEIIPNRVLILQDLLERRVIIPSFDDMARAYCNFLYKNKHLSVDFAGVFIAAKEAAETVKKDALSISKKYEKRKRIINSLINEGFSLKLSGAYYTLENALEDEKGSKASEEEQNLILDCIENLLDFAVLSNPEKVMPRSVNDEISEAAERLLEVAEERMNETNEGLLHSETDLYHWIIVMLKVLSIKDMDAISGSERTEEENEIIIEVFKDNHELQEKMKKIKQFDDADIMLASSAFIYYSYFWNNFSSKFDNDCRLCSIITLLIMLGDDTRRAEADKDHKLINIFLCAILGMCMDFDNSDKPIDLIDFIPDDRKETHDCYILRAALAAKLSAGYLKIRKFDFNDCLSIRRKMFIEISSLVIGEKTSPFQEEIENLLNEDKEKTEMILEDFIKTAKEILAEVRKAFED